MTQTSGQNLYYNIICLIRSYFQQPWALVWLL